MCEGRDRKESKSENLQSSEDEDDRSAFGDEAFRIGRKRERERKERETVTARVTNVGKIRV